MRKTPRRRKRKTRRKKRAKKMTKVKKRRMKGTIMLLGGKLRNERFL